MSNKIKLIVLIGLLTMTLAYASIFDEKVAKIGPGPENDPQVSTLTSGKWCSGTGSAVDCVNSPPVQNNTGGWNLNVSELNNIRYVLSNNYSHIQNEINRASAGDVIYISGFYNVYDEILINKSRLHIKCLDDKTIFNLSSVNSIFNITGNYNIVENCNFKGNGNTFNLTDEALINIDGNYNSIINNFLNHSRDLSSEDGNGIVVNYQRIHNLIRGNKIYSGRNNIFAYEKNYILDNYLGGASHLAVFLRIGTDNVVSRNVILDTTGSGIGLQGSTIYNPAKRNIITQNKIYGTQFGSGINLEIADDNIVTDNDIQLTYMDGIRLSAADRNVITNNNLKNNGENTGSSDEAISINTYSGTGNSTYNIISNNIIYQTSNYSRYAIYSDNDVNANNTIFSNQIFGFEDSVNKQFYSYLGNFSVLGNIKTNGVDVITDGNTNWDNTYGFMVNNSANYVLPGLKFTSAPKVNTQELCYNSSGLVYTFTNPKIGTIYGNSDLNLANPTATVSIILDNSRAAATIKGLFNVSTGETYLFGVKGDGTGKVVCVKSDGSLGTCTDQPGASGTCTCS